MSNHPHRGKPSRDALELIATFAAAGIALTRCQQDAAAAICRAAKTIKRVAEARCNGPPAVTHRTTSAAEWAAEWGEWAAQLYKSERAAATRIEAAWKRLPYVAATRIGADPRGATVKLVMEPEWQYLHNDLAREGICVPGS